MKRKLLAALLAGTMILSMAACGNKDSGASSSAGGSGAESSGNNSTAGGESGGAESDEVINVTMMVATKAGQGDWNDYWLMDKIEETCGIRFQVDQIVKDAWDEQVSLVFTSQKLPMVFLNDLSDTELATYGSQGLLLPLEDYISEETMPNLYRVMEEENVNLLAGMTFPDGHIYSLRGFTANPRELAKNRWFINKTWMERLGIEKMPETLDEFYDYLVAVRDGDPNQNGDTTDEIPLGGSYEEDGSYYYNAFIPILAAFGYLGDTKGADYQVGDDGKVFYIPAQDNYKEFLKYMHKLYEEKLLDQEYFTQNADQRKAKQADDKYGAFTDYASWMNIPDINVSIQFRGLEPFTSEYNSEKMWPSKDMQFNGGLVITKEVTDEAVIKRLISMADWFYSEEGTYTIIRGVPKGEWAEYPDYGWYLGETDRFGVVKVENDWDSEKYEKVGTWRDAEVTPGNNYFPMGQTLALTSTTIYTEEDYVMIEDTAVTNNNRLTTDIMTNLYDYLKVGWPGSVKFTQEENDEISLIETDLLAYKKTMESQMINGKVDIDAVWDEYIKGLNDRKLDRYLELLQGAYDRWASTK